MTPRQRERRFRLIREIGCVCCLRIGLYAMPEVHHQNLGAHAGGKRLGDDYTVGLCRWHHQGHTIFVLSVKGMERLLGPSLALTPRKFRERFGSDAELLAEQNRLIASRENLNVVNKRGCHVPTD